jgi:hypothetical protein
MNAIAAELEYRLNKFPETQEHINSGPGTLVRLIREALKDGSSNDCNETLEVIYESAITAANSFLKNNQGREAAKALYTAGMTAATLYFRHCEWVYAGKAVDSLREFIRTPYCYNDKLEKAQRTIDKILKH